MEKKILAATLYIKDGVPVKGPDDLTFAGDLNFLAKVYNDGGIDKIFVFDNYGNRYVIESLKALDRRSLRRIELYL